MTVQQHADQGVLIEPTERAVALIDLAAIAHNVKSLRGLLAGGVSMMAVVKADGYGHGAVPVARTALAAGADELGVATPDEALPLRAAGITAPITAWLWVPGQDLLPALAQGVRLGVSSLAALDAVLTAAADLGARPEIVLKVDSGLSRNGATLDQLPALAAAVGTARQAGRLRLSGVMSHLASADVPGDPSVGEQHAAFEAALAVLADHDAAPGARHLAATGGAIAHPQLHYDLVRIGIGLYGLDPLGGAGATPELRPAMSLRARIAQIKVVPAGAGVSYGLTYRTPTETTLALVPLGYADGVPRAASNSAEVLIGGRRRRIAGRVAMDQFVIDCGTDGRDGAAVAIGDEVVLFGNGEAGEPTATDWADACGTIDYEIVTRIGTRVPRRHLSGNRDGVSG